MHRDAATQQFVLVNGKSIKYSLSPSSQSLLIHYTALFSYGQHSCSCLTPNPDMLKPETALPFLLSSISVIDLIS